MITCRPNALNSPGNHKCERLDRCKISALRPDADVTCHCLKLNPVSASRRAETGGSYTCSGPVNYHGDGLNWPLLGLTYLTLSSRNQNPERDAPQHVENSILILILDTCWHLSPLLWRTCSSETDCSYRDNLDMVGKCFWLNAGDKHYNQLCQKTRTSSCGGWRTQFSRCWTSVSVPVFCCCLYQLSSITLITSCSSLSVCHMSVLFRASLTNSKTLIPTLNIKCPLNEFPFKKKKKKRNFSALLHVQSVFSFQRKCQCCQYLLKSRTKKQQQITGVR